MALGHFCTALTVLSPYYHNLRPPFPNWSSNPFSDRFIKRCSKSHLFIIFKGDLMSKLNKFRQRCYGWLSCLLSWKHNMTLDEHYFVLVEGLTTLCFRFPSCILVEKTSNLIFRGSAPTDIPRPLQILSVWSSSSQSLLVSSGKNTVPLPKTKQKILTEIRKFLPTFNPLMPEWHCPYHLWSVAT